MMYQVIKVPCYKQTGQFLQMSDDTGDIWAADWTSEDKMQIGDKVKVVGEMRLDKNAE